MKKVYVLGVFALLAVTGPAMRANGSDATLVVTSSNSTTNELLVFDTAGTLLQTVPTQGQGGVSGNAGGIATKEGSVAVVNFGSQSVSLFERSGNGFDLRQLVPTISAPVSVAFGKDHLYILGTTTVESHRIGRSGVDPSADGTATLARADGSAAQVGVAGDQLIISEKSGVVEVIQLIGGAVSGTAAPVSLPPDSQDTPFGLVTRGSSAYVTIAHSDEVGLFRNGQLIALAATGSNFPSGPGQQSPCWIALVGPYLFTSNSPSHSISRLIATGVNLVLDAPIAAKTAGVPVDIAVTRDVLAVVESNDGGVSHLTQFRVDEDGNLVQTVTSAIASAANGVAVVSGN